MNTLHVVCNLIAEALTKAKYCGTPLALLQNIISCFICGYLPEQEINVKVSPHAILTFMTACTYVILVPTHSSYRQKPQNIFFCFPFSCHSFEVKTHLTLSS